MSVEAVFKAIAEEQPEMMAKIAMLLRATEALDKDFAADTVGNFRIVAEYATEKTASWGGFGKGLLGAAGSALAGTLASDLYDVAKRGFTSAGNFSRIMDSNEALHSYDKADVKRAFNTLHRYAPEFTADPSVGGQIIHRMLETPHDQHNIVKDFLGARKNLRDVRKLQFSMNPVQYEDLEEKLEMNKRLEAHKVDEGIRRDVASEGRKDVRELIERNRPKAKSWIRNR